VKYMPIIVKQDATICSLSVNRSACYMFRVVSLPTIRSSCHWIRLQI